MDASTLPKMKSREVNGDGRPINLPGVYREKETGTEIITSDGDEGVAMADAIMATAERLKTTFERVGDVPSRVEILAMRKAQEVKDAAAEKVQKVADEAELKAATDKAVKAATGKTDAKLPAGGETYEPATKN